MRSIVCAATTAIRSGGALRLTSLALLFVALNLAGGAAETPAESSPAASIPVRICIDPGHPSEVGRGTQGKRLTEIAAAWQVAQRMRARLTQTYGASVALTKTGEEQYVVNRKRAETANEFHADLMVRLHCDGGNGIGSGFAVYVPERQGRSGGALGPSAQVLSASEAAGKTFYAILARDLASDLPARGLHPDTDTRVGASQGALTGSIYSKVPVVLVEMCVLTNPKDEAFMSSAAGQQKMADALADAAVAAAANRLTTPTNPSRRNGQPK